MKFRLGHRDRKSDWVSRQAFFIHGCVTRPQTAIRDFEQGRVRTKA